MVNCKVNYNVELVVNIEMPQIQYDIWCQTLESRSGTKIIPAGMEKFIAKPLPGMVIELNLFSNEKCNPHFLVKIFDNSGNIIHEDPSDGCRNIDNMFVFDNTVIRAIGFACIELHIDPLNGSQIDEEIHYGGCVSGFVRDLILSEVPEIQFDQAEVISVKFDNWLMNMQWVRTFNGKTYSIATREN